MKKKKNILLIISSLRLGGGAEKVCSILGSELKRQGYNINFLTFYDVEDKYPFEGNYNSLKEKLNNIFFIKIIKLFSRAYKVAKFCKRNNIDSSLSFMEEANFPNVLSKVLFGNKSKILISIRQSTDSISTLYQFLIKILYKKADYIIPNSKEEERNLINKFRFHKENLKSIYNPLDLDLINKKSKENLGKYRKIFYNNKFTFVTVGRLSYQKNQKFMIDAFDKFNQHKSNSQLVIIGDGNLKENLKKYSNNKNIYFLGKQKNVYKFLYNSDCFLFSSLWEGFPNAVMEAMACGLPIISTKFKTGIQELLSDNRYGLLVKKNNDDFFLKAMEEFYVNEQLKNYYKQKSLERAKDFNLEKIILDWESIL